MTHGAIKGDTTTLEDFTVIAKLREAEEGRAVSVLPAPLAFAGTHPETAHSVVCPAFWTLRFPQEG